MLLAKWIGFLLISFGTLTVLGAQTLPNSPHPSPSPALRPGQDPRAQVPPGDPTPANIKDWHCETPMLDLSSPTMAYKTLYFAVKCKNTATIKKVLSTETVKFITGTAAMQKKPFDEAIQNGLTESTYSPTLPQICKERIKDKMAAVELKGPRNWEDLPFILEDGVWKLAVGEIFSGSYQSPGPATCIPPMTMPQPSPPLKTAAPLPPVPPDPKTPPPPGGPVKP